MTLPQSLFDRDDRREFEAGPFLVTDARYAPRVAFGSHFHERPCVSVVLEGRVEKAFGSRRHTLTAPSALAMPPAEPHLAWIGAAGARVLRIEPENATDEHLASARGVFHRVTELHDSRLLEIAWRLREEIVAPDDVTPLAVDGLVREFMATAARVHGRAGGGPAPKWFRTTRDHIHARFADRLSVGSLAEEAGVHPTHLARTFRTHCGMSLAGYIRRLRVEWAALQLRTTDIPLCDIAGQAGFADQSHLTRVFRRHMGVSPGRYRATTGRRRR